MNARMKNKHLGLSGILFLIAAPVIIHLGFREHHYDFIAFGGVFLICGSFFLLRSFKTRAA